MNPKDFDSIKDWIDKYIDSIPYGEIVIRITRHDGQTRTIEKTVTEKEKPGE